MNYWIIKSEPNNWSWNDQNKYQTTMWDGVRNYQARNNLIAMKKNDLCFFYHSVNERQIVGIVSVIKEHYPDPTDKTGKFVAVNVLSPKVNPPIFPPVNNTEEPVILPPAETLKALDDINEPGSPVAVDAEMDQ